RQNPYLGAPMQPELSRGVSEETARMVDAEVHRIISDSQEEARRLLTEHRRELELLAEALLERETLDEEEILEVTGLGPAKPLEVRKAEAPTKTGPAAGRRPGREPSRAD